MFLLQKSNVKVPTCVIISVGATLIAITKKMLKFQYLNPIEVYFSHVTERQVF